MPDHVHSKGVRQGDINALGELVEPEYASSTRTSGPVYATRKKADGRIAN